VRITNQTFRERKRLPKGICQSLTSQMTENKRQRQTGKTDGGNLKTEDRRDWLQVD
jgi:hypothetical protein